VEFPHGKTMLIDGGGLYGDFDVGEKVIAPFLWQQRILHVDYLLLSHPQPDHYKGLIFIARHFYPREFWHNGMTSPSPTYGQLMKAIKEKGISVVPVEDGFTRTIAGVQFKALHPVEGWMGEKIMKRGFVNNNAVVFMLSFGNHRLLFTGDIEKKAETRLVETGKRLSAQVIKVPHHGSKHSSTETFLNKVSPRYAVISVGFANPHRLPNKETLRRYARLGCRVLRTDIDGAITVQSDGKQLTVRTYEKL
jgi:competence protein ComEC